MSYYGYRISECTICKYDYTSSCLEVMPGIKIYVCERCLESARDNFVWICLNCGQSYLRPKKTIMERRNGYDIREARILARTRIIQGLSMCIQCKPHSIMAYVKKEAQRSKCIH